MAIDLNLYELYYYPFIVSIGKCDGNCNTDADRFGRISAPFCRISSSADC